MPGRFKLGGRVPDGRAAMSSNQAISLAFGRAFPLCPASHSFGRGLNGGFGYCSAQRIGFDPASRVPALWKTALSPFRLQRGSAPRVCSVEHRRKALMALYEHIYLARQDVSPQQVEEMTNALTAVLTAGRRQGHQERVLGPQVPLATASRRTARRTTACSTSTPRPRPSPRWSARCASTKTSCAS